MTFRKVIVLLLAALLAVAPLSSCTPSDSNAETETTASNAETETTAPTTGKADMAAIRSEINSLKASDFTECTEKTEYVKITIQNHGDIITLMCPLSSRQSKKQKNLRIK